LRTTRRWLGSAGRIWIRRTFELTDVEIRQGAIGKIVVPAELHQHIVRSGVRILGLAPDPGLGVAELPMHRRDPFDRLLISRARC
jgi:PIN domain nuclease of toxin-antitoxin system